VSSQGIQTPCAALPDTVTTSRILKKVRKQLSRSKAKVKCHQNLITSRVHSNTYSYQVTLHQFMISSFSDIART